MDVVSPAAALIFAEDPSLSVTHCAICRNGILTPCVECQANDSTDCRVSWGQCKHCFHSHCLERWLRTRNVCPLDNREWEYWFPAEIEIGSVRRIFTKIRIGHIDLLQLHSRVAALEQENSDLKNIVQDLKDRLDYLPGTSDEFKSAKENFNRYL